MELEIIEGTFSVCKVKDYSQIDMNAKYFFTGKTDEENSLVCPFNAVPDNTTEREDGWKCIRIRGILDFSLIGILAKIAAILAENKIGIFVVSTFHTDYVFVKTENFEKSVEALCAAGYEFVDTVHESA